MSEDELNNLFATISAGVLKMLKDYGVCVVLAKGDEGFTFAGAELLKSIPLAQIAKYMVSQGWEDDLVCEMLEKIDSIGEKGG